jgi:hypothetical protein
VLKTKSGPKRDEVTGDRRKLLNEELHNLYSSPNIIRMIKSRNVRWAVHVARMLAMTSKNMKVRHHLEDLGIDAILLNGF